MYTIFVNNKSIILSDQIDTETDYEFCDYSQLQVAEVLHKLRNTTTKGYYIYHQDLELLWDKFKQFFVIVKAAGGVVIKDAKILLIYRNGFWDLPKGKMEKGETIEITALREVEEECSVQKLSIEKELPTTFHIFYEDDRYKLKKTYWFTMTTNDKTKPIPQKEEGISRAEYIPIQEVHKLYEYMYKSICELLRKTINT